MITIYDHLPHHKVFSMLDLINQFLGRRILLEFTADSCELFEEGKLVGSQPALVSLCEVVNVIGDLAALGEKYHELIYTVARSLLLY